CYFGLHCFPCCDRHILHSITLPLSVFASCYLCSITLPYPPVTNGNLTPPRCCDWLGVSERAEHCGKMEENVGRLQEQALKRKERLRELRKKRERDDGEPENKMVTGEEEEEETLKLRNYTPLDDDLKQRQVPQAQPISVEEKVKEQLEAAKPEPIIEEVDLANLAPRKPDWDLKRDVAKKLEKLEKRTQRAIAELIRERLKGQEENLATAMESVTQEDADSD
uniref:Coiled-coil domain containing 12 n=1 Tax=Leptobrachium leishanense TaxID=445787 RepID=A0A8C5MK89_9ANUR